MAADGNKPTKNKPEIHPADPMAEAGRLISSRGSSAG